MESKSFNLMTGFSYRALFLGMLTAAKLTSFNVAQSIDSDWTLDETEFTGCHKADDYFKRRDFHLTNAEISYDTDYCRNLIPDGRDTDEDTSSSQLCQRRRYPVKEYSKKDVVHCIDSLSAKRKGKRMHIAFIGDSLIRQVFLSFLRLFPDNDRKMRRSSTLHAEYHFHEDRNVTSSRLLNGLLVSFQWRHQIRKDLIADFKRWSTAVENKVPDLILLGITAHHITHNDITSSLEMYSNLLENKLVPLINASLNLHPRQEIVWMRASPTLDYIGPSWDRVNHDVVYDKILKYNANIIRIFKDTRVVIWDAVNVVVEEYLRACAITKIQRQDKTEYLNCKDVMHPGFGALAIAAQLIMNHICCPVA